MKARYADDDFTDEDVGQVLDFMRVLMSEVQSYRPFLFGILSDGHRFQFLRCLRTTDRHTFQYQKSSIYCDLDGWQILVGMMIQPLESLGYTKYRIEDVEVMDSLGYGGQSVVFNGIFNTRKNLVKVFHKEKFFDAEVRALELLASNNVKNVPTIIHQSVTSTGSRVLLVMPIAVAVQPKEDGRSVFGCHICQLIDVLKAAHTLGIVHNGWIGRWPFRGPAISTLASQRFALAADVGKLISPLCLFTEQVR